MAKFFDELNDDLCERIRAQHVFFTGSAPGQDGRVNISPKGMDTFRIFSSREVGYLDLTGSGNETAAHILDNGRLTIMFCSFDKKPWILRLYGRGRVVHSWDDEYPALSDHFEAQPGSRQIIRLAIESVQTSCGYAVPHMSFVGERDTLRRWAEQKSPEELDEYRAQKNAVSIDGLKNVIQSPRRDSP